MSVDLLIRRDLQKIHGDFKVTVNKPTSTTDKVTNVRKISPHSKMANCIIQWSFSLTTLMGSASAARQQTTEWLIVVDSLARRNRIYFMLYAASK